MGNVGAFSQDFAFGRVRSSYSALASLLRQHVEPAREEEIAAALPVARRTLQAWRYGETAVPGWALLKLFRLVPRLRNACLREFGCTQLSAAELRDAAATLALLVEREAA